MIEHYLTSYRRVLVLTLMMSTMLIGCASKREVRARKKPENKKVSELLRSMKEKRFLPEYLSMRAGVTVETGGKESSFKANIRMRRDSAVWISISAFGYEAARILATKDSVWVMNRSDRTYQKSDFNLLAEKMDLSLEFNAFQQILLGNDIGLDSLDKVKRSHDKDFYVLSSVSKRKLKKVHERPEKMDSDIYVSNKIDPESFRPVMISLFDLITNQSVSLKFSNFEPVMQTTVARSLMATIVARRLVEVKVEITRLEPKESLSFPFTIPSKYTYEESGKRP